MAHRGRIRNQNERKRRIGSDLRDAISRPKTEPVEKKTARTNVFSVDQGPNGRPFMEADVLRKRPNIKWGKDRGKNPPGSLWGEERDNDRHLTLVEKRAAQGE